MSEEWKQITEYVPKRGMTEVSSLGRVRKTFKERRAATYRGFVAEGYGSRCHSHCVG